MGELERVEGGNAGSLSHFPLFLLSSPSSPLLPLILSFLSILSSSLLLIRHLLHLNRWSTGSLALMELASVRAEAIGRL